MDIIVCLMLLSVFLYTRGQQAKITMVAFMATVAFSYSAMFELMPVTAIHLAYALILIPFILISNPKNATGLAIYALAQCFIMLDYLIYPTGPTWIENNYELMHNILDLCLIVMSLERRYNVDRNSNVNIYSVFNREQLSACIQKMEKT